MEKPALDVRRKQSTPCQALFKHKQNRETSKLRSGKGNRCPGYDMQPFLKRQHPGIHLCVLSSSPKFFSLETANSCNGSKKGTLGAANLRRKTTKQSCFLCCEPQRHAPILRFMEELGSESLMEGKLKDLEVHLENYIFLIPNS